MGLKEPNPVGAVAWFTRAADLGDAASMFHLATCYEKGTGVGAMDLFAARKWCVWGLPVR